MKNLAHLAHLNVVNVQKIAHQQEIAQQVLQLNVSQSVAILPTLQNRTHSFAKML